MFCYIPEQVINYLCKYEHMQKLPIAYWSLYMFEHIRETDDSIKVCLVMGHLRVCGWASSWKEIAPLEARLHRMANNNGRIHHAESV